MLHQCGHRQCSCASSAATPSFSIFFPMSGSKSSSRGADDGEVLPESSKSDNINSSSSAVTTVVDCTLSLGTPSTRLGDEKQKSFAASSSSFRWDVIPKKHASQAATGGGDDQLLLARRCANCNTTSTPLWRNGPRGPKSLCNACGIRYKKEERRAAATAPSPSLCLPSSSAAATEQALGYGYYRQTPQQYSPWGGNCYAPTSTAASVEDVVDGDLPYHSWRLKLVPPPAKFSAVRPGLFQYN